MGAVTQAFKWFAKAEDEATLAKAAERGASTLRAKAPGLDQTAYGIFHPYVLDQMGKANGNVVFMKPQEVLQLMGDTTGLTATERLKLRQNLIPRSYGAGLPKAVTLQGVATDGRFTVGEAQGLEGAKLAAELYPDKMIPVLIQDAKGGKLDPNMGALTYGKQKNNSYMVPGRAAEGKPQFKETVPDMYLKQEGREFDILRRAMDPETAQDFKFTIGSGNDPASMVESGFANTNRTPNPAFRARVAEGRVARQNADYELYREIRSEMGDAAFDKAFKGKGVTRRQILGDTGEFADYPFLTTRVETLGTHARGAPLKGVPASVGPREAGIHMGDSGTMEHYLGFNQTRRDTYEEAKQALRTSKDKEEIKLAKRMISDYEADLKEASEEVSSFIAQKLPGITDDEVDEFTAAVADFADDWAKEGDNLQPKQWAHSGAGKRKLAAKMSKEGDIPPADAAEIVAKLASYYRLASGSPKEARAFAMTGFKKPLVIHDLHTNTAEAIGKYISAMPQFAPYREQLENLGKDLGNMAGTERLAAMSDKLFDILGKRGYDHLAYVNQAEGAATGVSPSFIFPRETKGKLKNVREAAPEAARKRNLLGVTAVMAPVLGALAKPKQAEASESK